MTATTAKMAPTSRPLTPRERATVLGALWLWGNMATGGDWMTDNPPEDYFVGADPLTAAEADSLMGQVRRGEVG